MTKRNIEDYKSFGKNRITIKNCGCVKLDGNKVLDYCNEHTTPDIFEKLKQKKIKEIKNRTGIEIEKTYPIYKQINIAQLLNGYIEEDRTDYWNFINSKLEQKNNFIKQVKDIDIVDIEKLRNFTYKFIEKQEK